MSFPCHFPVGLDVQWTQPELVELNDPYLKNWLLDTGSLTERVQSHCHHFSLALLGQGTVALEDSEKLLLQGNSDSDYQVREVLLCDNSSPWIFARSVIPQDLIAAELANLGQEPLGKRLFNDKRFIRSGFEVCCLLAEDLGINSKQQLWGRRSMFTLGKHNLIVAEIFLPHAPVYLARQSHDTERK